MAPGNGRRRQVASRHLVCASCSSWIQFDSSGCDTAWAETREGSFTFTCKGCKRVEFLVRELAEYRKLLKKTKEARVEQIILSGILPVFGNRIDGYRNSKRMAINGMVKRLCKEEDVGYVDLWDSVVGKEGMYARDGLHLSGKGAAVFAEGLSGAVASGLGKVRYLN